MNKKTIKAVLYSLAIIFTVSAISINVSAAETNSTKNDKKSERVASFSSEKEFQNLIKKYPIVDKSTGKKITELKVDFSDPSIISLNQDWYLNDGTFPITDFSIEENSTVKFKKTNQLKKRTTICTLHSAVKHVDSKMYRLLNNKIRLRGYINKNGTYHAVILYYRIHGDYFQNIYTTLGEFDESDCAMPNFRIKNALNIEKEEKLELQKAKEKKEKAKVGKRNTYIKASLLIVASSAITATIFKLKNKKSKKSGEDEND